MEYVNLALLILGSFILMIVMINQNHDIKALNYRADLNKAKLDDITAGRLDHLPGLHVKFRELGEQNLKIVNQLYKYFKEDIELVANMDYKGYNLIQLDNDGGTLNVVLVGTFSDTTVPLLKILKRAETLKKIKAELCCKEPSKRTK